MKPRLAMLTPPMVLVAMLTWPASEVCAGDFSQPEYFPASLAEEVREREAKEASELAILPPSVASYVLSHKRWPIRQLTVAFLGGSPELRQKVIDAARHWEQPSNSVRFDFGDKASGYRSWSKNDTKYSADIRVAFGQQYVGYWSAVGSDSMKPPFLPGVESMNFASFLLGTPGDYETVVLHEFAHALGFEHEFRRAECHAELRWIDSGGGQRTVYKYFEDEFGWSTAQVNQNFAVLMPVSGDELSHEPDPFSIATYPFAREIFLDPDTAQCLSGPVSRPSPGDYAGVAIAYPATNNPAVLTSAALDALSEAGSKLPQDALVQKYLKIQENIIRGVELN